MKKGQIVAGVCVLGLLILGMTLTFRLGALATPLLGTPQPQSLVEIQAPMPAGFTYQGQLKIDGERVDGDCTMAFRLFDADTGGAQVGSAITRTVNIAEDRLTIRTRCPPSPIWSSRPPTYSTLRLAFTLPSR